MKTNKILGKNIEKFNKLGKVKIAFGLKEPDEEILKSLKQSKEFADITLVGPQAIEKVKGFKLVIDALPEERLANLLAKDEVEGIIRGTIDDFKTYEAYQKLTNEAYTFSPAVIEDSFGRQFLLTAASNPDDWDKEQRLRHAVQNGEFLKAWGVVPRIAVFTGERHETYPRRKHIRDGVIGILNKTYEDAEWIVAELKKQGYEAKNWAIDLNPAVAEGYNVICPVNGMVGNQIFRVVLFCGGKVLTATRLGLSRMYEDNSQTEKDFVFHVKWLNALINKKKFKP
ncbi:hypothetical protein C4546_03580 [Candidatus Parcubacteria bacterium]|jgi:predicted methyltransferase MtxX (methanogen marker protein 4)|nr:MAG: hypothetical protein C4546_03580 [Candidatus Parcubacteria bacterium]